MFYRACFSVAALGAAGALAIVPAVAQAPYDELADRQAEMDEILNHMPLQRVIERRRLCASGITGELHDAVGRALGAGAPFRTADLCLAELTRAAREGRMEPITSSRAPAAAALDAGFMSGFRQGGPIPAGLPMMVALKPVAERCLAQREANVRLCSAAGFALGLRAYHGEIVRAG